MSPSALAARFVGLLVAVTGGVLAWGGLLAPVAGARGIDLLARGAITNLVVAAGLGGLTFVFAGLAVLAGRGRSVAVSVGGAVLVAVVALLALGTGPVSGVLGVGVAALALLLAGASIDSRAAA